MRVAIRIGRQNWKAHPAEPESARSRIQRIEADFAVDTTLAEAGGKLFERGEIEGICWYCHGMFAISGGAAPDLRASTAVLDRDTFDRIVRGGALSGAGMPALAELTDAEVDSLQWVWGRNRSFGRLALTPD